MNAKEMQISFERKIQLMDPTLIADAKLDSDSIFAFINAAQNRFVVVNYMQGDQYVMDTNAFAKNSDSIKNLIVEETLTAEDLSEAGNSLYKLPSEQGKQFFLYIDSFTKVNKTYLGVNSVPSYIQNQLIKHTDVDKYTSNIFNTPIIRTPGVVLVGSQFAPNSGSFVSGPSFLKLHTDSHTEVANVLLTYCRAPRPINTIIKTNHLTQSELSENVHDEIVDMAVELFITEAKYRLSVKQPANE